jgi:ABC-type dipeptide/oligopeptide/nickel transport system permease component
VRVRFWKYAAQRLIFLVPQLFIVSVIVFFLVRLLPGDPSYLLAGPFATVERVEEVRRRLGLDQPLHLQYLKYLQSVIRGEFGTSWITSQPVLTDIRQRLPATMELVLLAVFFSAVIGIPLGVFTAIRKRGVADMTVFAYGMLAGALPDFWFALIIIFLFFYKLGWFPGPIGRLDLMVSQPHHITGMYAVDALMTGNWPAFTSALLHLVLPVTTLVAVYMPLVMKNARSTMEEMLSSDFVTYARAVGLSRFTQLRYALRNAMPPVLTVIGIMFWFLLGGAVLVETVFAWGGLGQYAVQAVVNSDYAPLQAFVLLAAVSTIVVFLLVDLAYFLLDPRIKA